MNAHQSEPSWAQPELTELTAWVETNILTVESKKQTVLQTTKQLHVYNTHAGVRNTPLASAGEISQRNTGTSYHCAIRVQPSALTRPSGGPLFVARQWSIATGPLAVGLVIAKQMGEVFTPFRGESFCYGTEILPIVIPSRYGTERGDAFLEPLEAFWNWIMKKCLLKEMKGPI